MSEFTVMVLRFAFFALLWIFVFLVAGVLRQDLFGPRRSNRVVTTLELVAPGPSHVS